MVTTLKIIGILFVFCFLFVAYGICSNRINTKDPANISQATQKADDRAVVESLQKAAEQGDALSQYSLGKCYFNGIGVTQDYAKAYNWFLKAANQGLTEAQHQIGTMALEGKGCEKSIEKMLQFYRAAYEKELKEGTELSNRMISFANQDEDMRLLCKVAQSGDAEALYILGVFIWHNKDYNLSCKLMEASAAFGDMNGMFELGRHYFYGYIGFTDYNIAKDLWRYAADRGNGGALRELGDCSTDDRDYTQAFKYYLKSAETGYDAGRVAVAECYLTGSGCDKNVDEGIKWLNDILRYNHAQPGFNWNAQWVQAAMYYLGFIYLGNLGDEYKDMDKGIALLKDAIDVNDRFTSQIAKLLVGVYSNVNSVYYNPQEAQKYSQYQ